MSDLGMIIPTLIGQHRAEIEAQRRQDYSDVNNSVNSFNLVLQHPDATPEMKKFAAQQLLDIAGDHGVKEDQLPQLGHVLTQIAAPSMIAGHFKRHQQAQANAAAQQKIRQAAGFTSPVPEGLKDPNMTIGTGGATSPPSELPMGPEANARPAAFEAPELPFAPGAQPSLRTLAGMDEEETPNQSSPEQATPSQAAPPTAPSQPEQPEEPTRRKLSLAGPGAATTVPYTGPPPPTARQTAQPQRPPGPTPPSVAYPLLAQLANTHLTRMQKFGRAMAAMGAGLQGRTWTSPENQLKAQIQHQQMMQALQQQQQLQRWYAVQQYAPDATSEEKARYALTGQLPASTTGTSRMTEFILPDGSTMQLEYDPRTHKAYGATGQEVQLPRGTQFGASDKGANTVYEQLTRAHEDLANPKSSPARKAAAKEFIDEKKKNSDVGAPPGYERGAPSMANPNMSPGLEGDAIVYLVTGKLPTMGGFSKGGSDYKQRVSQRAGEIRVNWGMEATDIVPLQVLTAADRVAFGRINNMDHAIGQLESTLAKNMDLAKRLSAAYQRGDIQLLNRIQNAIKTGKGDQEALDLAAQLHGVALEWAKIMEGGAMSAAGVHISSAEAAEGIISDRMGNGQLVGLFDNVITKDAQNRSEAIAGEKIRIMNEMRNPAAVFGAGGAFGGGAGGAGPLGGQLPRVSTQQEYDALPDGARYMDAQTGDIATKKKRQ